MCSPDLSPSARAAGGIAAADHILAEFLNPGIVWIVSWKLNAFALVVLVGEVGVWIMDFRVCNREEAALWPV